VLPLRPRAALSDLLRIAGGNAAVAAEMFGFKDCRQLAGLLRGLI
jgi:hypothetical protein